MKVVDYSPWLLHWVYQVTALLSFKLLGVQFEDRVLLLLFLCYLLSTLHQYQSFASPLPDILDSFVWWTVAQPRLYTSPRTTHALFPVRYGVKLGKVEQREQNPTWRRYVSEVNPADKTCLNHTGVTQTTQDAGMPPSWFYNGFSTYKIQKCNVYLYFNSKSYSKLLNF